MTLLRRLSLRFVVIAVITALVSLGIGGVLARHALRDALCAVAFPIARKNCNHDSAAWTFEGPGDMRAYAYDPDGRTLNPQAPPLDRELLRELPPGMGESAWDARMLGRRGRMLLRVSAQGPCAILQAEFTPILIEPALRWRIGGAVLVTILLAVALWLVWIARPLERRARQLGQAAAKLDDLARVPVARAGDELDSVLGSLMAADARIRQDGELLAQRARALERHLSEVAHDVRTPLLALQLAVEQAADLSLSPGAGPTVRDLLGSALRDCVYLADLTENLRMQSLLDEGWAPALAPTDLGAALERICLRAASLGRRHGIEVGVARPDEPVTVRCDAIAFERAVSNLLDNAVAYADPGGHVAATISTDATAFELIILDDGPGIAEHQLAELTARRFRCDEARGRDPRGSGLGLFITAEICARFGWQLTFSAAHPRGLRVSIRGPLAS
jgi:signal transduction histidine kinase